MQADAGPSPSRAGPGDVVTVLLADDDALARLGLRTLLRAFPEIAVIAETADPAALADLIAGLGPDVLVVDERFGADSTGARLRSEAVRPPALVVMAAGAPGRITEQGGVTPSTIVAKAAPALEIVAAITAVAGRPPPRRSRPAGVDALTPRETEVLALVARGLTNDEVSAHLGLSLETVRTHLKHIYGKCGVNDRTHAVIAAYQGGLAAPP